MNSWPRPSSSLLGLTRPLRRLSGSVAYSLASLCMKAGSLVVRAECVHSFSSNSYMQVLININAGLVIMFVASQTSGSAQIKVAGGESGGKPEGCCMRSCQY